MIKNLVFGIEDISTGGTIYPTYSIEEMFFGVNDFLTNKEEGKHNFIEVAITETEEGFKADVYDKDIICNHDKESVSYKVIRFELLHTIHSNNDVEILIKARDFVKEVLLYKQYVEHHRIDVHLHNYHIDHGVEPYKKEFERVKEQY